MRNNFTTLIITLIEGGNMSYLKEFQREISKRDFSKFMVLWEEYCTSDSVPSAEIVELLEMIKRSDFSKPMGKIVETIVPLIETLPSPDEMYSALKLVVDLQTTQSPKLAETALEHADRRYRSHQKYHDFLRLVGLRSKDQYQGALSALDLLTHLGEKKFVFHTGGWGVGEIIELSYLRETAVIEFENSPGKKNISFVNAMKTLIPLQDNHFLARRFGNPDALEKRAKEDPVAVIKMLLTDLGPKTAAEIKDEMCELVIPEADWTKWWSQARAKLKRDLLVDSPDNLKEPFKLRAESLSYEEEFFSQIGKKKAITDILANAHSFSKEHSQQLKSEPVRSSFIKTLSELEERQDLPLAQEVEIHLMKQTLFPDLPKKDLNKIFSKAPNIADLIGAIEIQQYKKQAWIWVRENKENWPELFVMALENPAASLLREYFIKELSSKKETLHQLVEDLLHHPSKNPELFFWFFQREILQKKLEIPLSIKPERGWEALLTLLSQIENLSSYADLTRKINQFLLQNRYQEVRKLFKTASLPFTKEFLLLASKCHSLSNQDQKSLLSLAAVHFPELAKAGGGTEKRDRHVLWTTKGAFEKIQERIRHIATVETIDNAREIEAARALGDLRENAEYKFAKERRARLQGEMRRLSEEMSQARILVPDDVSQKEVGVGSVVQVEDSQGKVTTYQILGPWDADPEKHILSSHSKLAEAMHNLSVGDTFGFKEETFTIKSLKTIFDL